MYVCKVTEVLYHQFLENGDSIVYLIIEKPLEGIKSSLVLVFFDNALKLVVNLRRPVTPVMARLMCNFLYLILVALFLCGPLFPAVEIWSCFHMVMYSLSVHYYRELIERYYSDPQMGVSSLDLLTQIIPSVSQSEVINDEEREELGSKIFYVMNGLV